MHSEKDEESLRENKIKILGTFRLGLQPPDALDVSGVGRRVVGGADVAGVTNLTISRINENIVKAIDVSIVIFIVTIFLIPAFHLKISYCGTAATALPVVVILITIVMIMMSEMITMIMIIM